MVMVSVDEDMHYLVLFCDLPQEGLGMISEEMIQSFVISTWGLKMESLGFVVIHNATAMECFSAYFFKM